MNFLVTVLMLFVFPLLAFGHTSAEQEYALNRMNGVARKYELGTRLREDVQTAVGKYSFALQGGSSAASIYLLKDLTANTSANRITIPDNAIIRQVYVDVLTAPQSSSIAVSLQAAGDLKASLAAASWSGIVAGIPIGDASHMIKLTADRQPYLTVSGPGLTAGIINFYIDYVVGD